MSLKVGVEKLLFSNFFQKVMGDFTSIPHLIAAPAPNMLKILDKRRT